MHAETERGFTLVELTIGLSVLAILLLASSGWIFEMYRGQAVSLRREQRREARQRALGFIREQVSLADKVVPVFGAIHSGHHAVVLERPTFDTNGYRKAEVERVAIQWLTSDRLLAVNLTASGSALLPKEFSLAVNTGEVAFNFLGADGSDARFDLSRATAIQVRVGGGTPATFALGAGR